MVHLRSLHLNIGRSTTDQKQYKKTGMKEILYTLTIFNAMANGAEVIKEIASCILKTLVSWTTLPVSSVISSFHNKSIQLYTRLVYQKLLFHN